MDWTIASDHAAFDMRVALVEHLREKGYSVHDNGTETTESVDYPDMANLVARDILSHKASYGILLCGTGIGVSMRANRFKGIRAAVATTPFMAEMARAHNHANVLCLGARVLSLDEAKKCVDTFIETQEEGDRHTRRVAKIDEPLNDHEYKAV